MTSSIRLFNRAQPRSCYALPHVRCTQRAPLQPLIPAARLADWKGTDKRDHGVNRAKNGDATDPISSAVKSGLKEKNKGNGVKDKTKSQATTERDEQNSRENAEKEFPKAPRPIIGVQDERGKVRD